MTKLIELERDDYTSFVEKHKNKLHFLQSYEWGMFSKEKKNLKPYYLGLVDNSNTILSATLLLEKKLPLGYSYFYAPRGFVIDFKNKELLSQTSKEIIKFVKNKKGIFLKIDPDIIIKKYNYLDEEIPLDYDYKEIFHSIEDLGFKHLGFTKNFETNQPRYTFRIDLNQSLEEIESHFSKTTKQRIKKANKLSTEVYVGNEKDIETFYNLMALTETRKDFVSYSDINYYKKLYEIFKEKDMIKLFIGKINIERSLEILQDNKDVLDKQIEKLSTNETSKSKKNQLRELTSQQDNLEKEINKYNNILNEYGNELILSAHMIIKYGDKAWVLYAGNHNELPETYVNYKTYFEHLKYCKEKGIKVYDQFGTIGDLTKDNPRIGLHEFKKKFGGDYIEFIGEFDYVIKPFMYFMFTKLVPLYRNIVKRKAKKEINDEVSRVK